MNSKEIISLLRLLEDPDYKVYELVREKILNDSDFFKIYLENYHSFSVNNLGLDRSEELLDEIFYIKFEEKLKKYLSKSNPSLAEGVFIFETYFNRDVDINQIEAYFDEILRSVWIELNEQLTGIEKVRVISKVLFDQYKLKKYPSGEYNTDYLSITNCLSYKKYVAPTISLLYCMIMQNTSIPAFPVDIPGIFLLGYYDQELADAVFDEGNNGIVFYFHPYDQGTLINQQIIEKYIKDNKLDLKISKIKTISYIDYLRFIFELRIMAIKQKNKDGFCIKYADKVSTILGNKAM
ncbi:MAG TPA: transglutaminase family protein [Bacteroidales bacterium]|nr:transglutaminase family protein [Bacteroidales bacterium]